MMKTFYTERDVEEMHAAGVTQIENSDNVVLTDLAREKAQDLGMTMVTGSRTKGTGSKNTTSLSTSTPASPVNLAPNPDHADLVDHIKARVIARLGTSDYNELLDQVIPQVLAQLNVHVRLDADTLPTTSNSY